MNLVSKAATRLVVLGVTLVSFTSCGNLVISPSLAANTETVYPLAGFSSADSTIYNSTIVAGAGYLPDSTRWSLGTDGSLRGVFQMSGGVASMMRTETSGPACDDGHTAPECGFTWASGGSGVYAAGDYDYFPNTSLISTTFAQLAGIDVDMKQQLLTGDLAGGFAECGVSIGLGSTQGSNNAIDASNNFQINGRAVTDTDMIRFQHRITSGGSEEVQVDTLVNSDTDSSYNAWGTASWNAFNVVTDNQLLLNSDYVTLHAHIAFSHLLHQVTITFTPTATNKDLSLMQSHTETWDYLAAQGTTVGGEPRAGIVIGSGVVPISLTDLLTARASIGFNGNGVVKLCQFSNLAITRYKN